jgi:acyl-CoA thioesterase-2
MDVTEAQPIAVPDGSGPLDRLLGILDLEQVERDLFRGQSPAESAPRVFGGQVAAQALVAATRTVEEQEVHSLHAYFLRPGDPHRPIVYEVDRIRDGRSYTTRRVVAIQAGKAIFNLQASFHRSGEDGFEHQVDAPVGIPEPESLRPAGDRRLFRSLPRSFLHTVRPIETRFVPEHGRFGRYMWMRANGTLGDDVTLHRCIAAYASDLSLLPTAMLPHGWPDIEPGMLASLDHAMWFHRPFRADEWLLYEQESASATGGRAMCRGRIWTREGALAVSVAQEGVLRPGPDGLGPDGSAPDGSGPA